MCLAIPGQVKTITGRKVVIQYPGETREAMVGVENLHTGDYVMVQMGIVVRKIAEDEAKSIQSMWTQNAE